MSPVLPRRPPSRQTPHRRGALTPAATPHQPRTQRGGPRGTPTKPINHQSLQPCGRSPSAYGTRPPKPATDAFHRFVRSADSQIPLRPVRVGEGGSASNPPPSPSIHQSPQPCCRRRARRRFRRRSASKPPTQRSNLQSPTKPIKIIRLFNLAAAGSRKGGSSAEARGLPPLPPK